jgi:hypothetical protein
MVVKRLVAIEYLKSFSIIVEMIDQRDGAAMLPKQNERKLEMTES